MFRKMRLTKQELSQEETLEILKKNGTGTLAINGLDGYPYSVPINYAYVDGKLYFHGAKSGHKFEAIQADSKASISIIDTNILVKEKFTTDFRSVIAFGEIRIMEKDEISKSFLKKFALAFCPDMDMEADAEINKGFKNVAIFEMELLSITGKKAIY